MMVGIFAGALTSTPAFSAAKATAESEYESAVTVGYGLAYIFGVLGIVIFVQIVPKISDVDMDIERELIMDKDYKITKRVGTDKTEHSERTKISKSISIEINKNNQNLNIMNSKKSDTLEVIEKESKDDTKNPQLFMSISTKTIEKENKTNRLVGNVIKTVLGTDNPEIISFAEQNVNKILNTLKGGNKDNKSKPLGHVYMTMVSN